MDLSGSGVAEGLPLRLPRQTGGGTLGATSTDVYE